MAMSDFMAMAMGVPCYGHDHAMFAVRNMVMAVSGHGHVIAKANVMAKAMILEKLRAKAMYLARVMTWGGSSRALFLVST